MRWKSLVVTTLLAAGLFALGELAGTGGERTVAPVAAHTLGGAAVQGGTLVVSVGAVTPAPGIPGPVVEPPTQAQPEAEPAPAAAAPNRSLCSAASEAVGLCTPQ